MKLTLVLNDSFLDSGLKFWLRAESLPLEIIHSKPHIQKVRVNVLGWRQKLSLLDQPFLNWRPNDTVRLPSVLNRTYFKHIRLLIAPRDKFFEFFVVLEGATRLIVLVFTEMLRFNDHELLIVTANLVPQVGIKPWI